MCIRDRHYEYPDTNFSGYRKYHENGQIFIEGKFKNHLPDSLWSVYGIEGSIAASINFKNGKLDGLTKQYFPSRNRWFERNYRNGEIDSEIHGGEF